MGFGEQPKTLIFHEQAGANDRFGFMEFLDKDGEVERFLKINESQHPFAVIYYMRKDGLMATYHPDFIVATEKKNLSD